MDGSGVLSSFCLAIPGRPGGDLGRAHPEMVDVSKLVNQVAAAFLPMKASVVDLL